MSSSSTPVSFAKFQRWVVLAIVSCIVLYVGFSVWSGLDDIGQELRRFNWWMFVAAIGLTLTNYALRFVKWHYLLGRLDVQIPWVLNAWNFTAGLSMAISPGKAGELLKPYFVRRVTKTPMVRTIPALITERLTDGIAMLLLAGVGVTTYAADQIEWLVIPSIITVVGLLVLASKSATDLILRLLTPLPVFDKLIPKISEMIDSMRTCVAPIPLLWTVILSVVAWGAECLAFQLIFKGMGVEAGFDVCFFLYAFATVAGSAMPGGLGVADGALVGGAMQFLTVTEGQAVTAALLTRVATLWLGVGLGALALLKVSSILEAFPAEDDTHTDDNVTSSNAENSVETPDDVR